MVIQKKDQFEVGYKPNLQGRRKLIEEKRGKRIVSFLEKAVEDFKMEIPPLSYSFRSMGFINFGSDQDGGKSMAQELDVNKAFGSLTISMIGAEPKASNIGLPPFLCGQILNNWTVIELLVVFKFFNE